MASELQHRAQKENFMLFRLASAVSAVRSVMYQLDIVGLRQNADSAERELNKLIKGLKKYQSKRKRG